MKFHRAVTRTILAAFCLGFVQARADELKAMMEARSMGQLAGVIEKSNRLRRARSVCEAELRNKRLPVHCFLVVELEDSVLKSDTGRELAWLEAICLERVSGVRDQNLLKLVASRPFVPAACREAAKREAEDLDYADGSAYRADRFLRRHKFH